MADQILGIGDMRAKFAKLTAGMETRASRVMVVAGGQILKTEAKSIASKYGFKKTGALLKNIVIKRQGGTPAGRTEYHLGVRHGRKLTKKQKTAPGKRLAVSSGRIVTRYKDDPFYWRFLEDGWIPRAPGKALRGGKRKKEQARSRDRAKKIPARPFIAQALVNKKDQAIDAMAARLQAELDKATQ